MKFLKKVVCDTFPSLCSKRINEGATTTVGKHSNIDDNQLGIQGYDPVSYFQNDPQKGSEDYAASFNGVHYLFINQENQKEFESNPEKYEPAAGGWCAWAMVEGHKVSVNPETYLIIDDKVHLFFKNALVDTKDKWEKTGDEEKLTAQAKEKWDTILEE